MSYEPIHINETHVSFDGTSSFNDTVLRQFNYTIFSNGTLSNNSRCYLIFGRFVPTMLENGTVHNGTKCSEPVDPIEIRGGIGIAFAVLFAMLIVTGLVTLRKQGTSHLPVERIYRPVSRRWPWYWVILTAVLGCISCFMAIDVDREYIQSTAIILQSIFYTVMLPVALAAVWELTRHWASWEERKLLDVDPYHFPAEDRRSKVELYIPLFFYLFSFLTFFLSVLRTWTPVRKQDPYAATDGRFRASSIMALIALIIIVLSAFHTHINYHVPIPFVITISCFFLLVKICFQIVCVFSLSGWNVNPLKYDANNGFVYGLGYAPLLVMLAIMIAYGWRKENEDLQLIKMRRQREFVEEVELKQVRRQQAEERRQQAEERRKEREKEMDMERKGDLEAARGMRETPSPNGAAPPYPGPAPDEASTLVGDRTSLEIQKASKSPEAGARESRESMERKLTGKGFDDVPV